MELPLRIIGLTIAIALFSATPALADICDNRDREILMQREVDTLRTGPPPVLLIDDETLNDLEPVYLSLGVDVEGRVTCLNILFGQASLFPQALELARQWRFKPYLKDGKPVAYTFDQNVDVRWLNPRPTVRVPFPAIRDWSSLRVRLEMSPAYMDCISYTVEIAGDGTLVFEGDYGKAGSARQTERLTPAIVEDLFEHFRKADYFWLHNSYTGDTHHAPYGWLSIAFDGRKKRVRHEVGEEAGMPIEVSALKDEVDRLADTERRTKNVKCRNPFQP